MGGSGNSRLAKQLILASLAIVALFSVVFFLGSSSTEYGVEHAIDIKSGSTSFSESFTFTVGPLSSWRDHVLELHEEYIQYASVENATSLLVTVNAFLTVNGAEAEGFTHSIDAFQGRSRSMYELILPQDLLHAGENNVILTYQIEVEGLVEPATDIELVYSGYRIKTS